MRYLLFFIFVQFLLFSCNNTTHQRSDFMEMEFMLVDSLVFDEMQILRILDYSPTHGMYLMVNQGVEGRYFLIDEKGGVLVEKVLSEGPDAFGMVLHRAGFVGDEVMFISDQKVFVYDLNLRQIQRFPFEQDVRVRMIHYPLDNLNTALIDGKPYAIANLSDKFLQEYPEHYFDTLNYVHLIGSKEGEVIKGGKIDESSIFKQGYFYMYRDKPVFFSDLKASTISMILPADSVLYQFDPKQNLKIANKIKLERRGPDRLSRISIKEASIASFKENGKNVSLGGSFTKMVGAGGEFLVEYKTGIDPDQNSGGTTPEEYAAIQATTKLYYYPIRDGRQIGDPVLWDKPGVLILGLGNNRYLQYADQAEIHDTEKDYQCYYIFELREKRD